jgi:hypothetical protein
MGGRVVKGRWAITADCAHTFSSGGKFVNFTRPVCEKSERGDLTTAAKSEKRRFWRNNSLVFAAPGGGAAAVEGELLRQGKKGSSK